MAKRLKLRICRALASTMQSCRSKDPSTLPQNPVPSFLPPIPPNPKLSTIHFPLQRDQIPRRSLKHHVSSSFVSIGPGNTQPSCDNLVGSRHQEFKWKKEGKWHVVDKICDKKAPRRETKMEQEDFPPPAPEVDKKKRRMKKKKNLPSRLRISASSGDSGWFSSEGGGGGGGGAEVERDEEETETLVSSNSMNISSDSSAKETQPFPSNPPQHRNNKRRSVPSRRRRGVSNPPPEADGEVPARLSMLKKLIPCTVDGKVKESFAVVKKSEDPYEDFKSSMMDMILEKQMFEEKDLEQLLQCFLSLNSRHYHGIIVQAFCEIWDTIFSPSTPHQ